MNAERGRTPPPCVVFEDEHLLVVNKPPGWNTHSPAPFAGEGIYDWLKHREPRWASLAIIHRLDKETSGLMVFGKTPLANKSLTEQFAGREVEKTYLLVTNRPVVRDAWSVETAIVRAGERYVARPLAAGGQRAETHFRVVRCDRDQTWLEAQPVTGRTHQIRVHAAHEGLPILGDTLYGGTAAPRVCLHAAKLAFRHPESGVRLEFQAEPNFFAHVADGLRTAICDPMETNCLRLRHGAADDTPGYYAERLGEFALIQGERKPAANEPACPSEAVADLSAPRGTYFKVLTRQVRQVSAAEASPQLLHGEPAPDEFTVRENGVQFEVSFREGYSYGLFLDQRDNRRRLLVNHVAAGFPLFPDGLTGLEVLNCFAYTCAFSVCAALAGARMTSLDLSRKYLDWGRRNFVLNGLDPAAHDFIYGDTFEWLRRLAKKGRRFDAILLDPPTFSRSKERGDFRAETDYGSLAAAALPLLTPSGVLFASTNAARMEPEDFLAQIRASVVSVGRRITQEHYVPQPPDFPITRDEPAHLKTVWLRAE